MISISIQRLIFFGYSSQFCPYKLQHISEKQISLMNVMYRGVKISYFSVTHFIKYMNANGNMHSICKCVQFASKYTCLDKFSLKIIPVALPIICKLFKDLKFFDCIYYNYSLMPIITLIYQDES